MPVAGRRALLATTIVAVLVAGSAAALIRWGEDSDPLWPLPANTATTTPAATASVKAAPGTFRVEGELAGGGGGLLAVSVHDTLAVSEEASSFFTGACPTITISVPPDATAIDLDGSVVPLPRVLGSEAYVRVVGLVWGDHLVYQGLRVIPAPGRTDTCRG